MFAFFSSVCSKLSQLGRVTHGYVTTKARCFSVTVVTVRIIHRTLYNSPSFRTFLRFLALSSSDIDISSSHLFPLPLSLIDVLRTRPLHPSHYRETGHATYQIPRVRTTLSTDFLRRNFSSRSDLYVCRID